MSSERKKLHIVKSRRQNVASTYLDNNTLSYCRRETARCFNRAVWQRRWRV